MTFIGNNPTGPARVGRQRKATDMTASCAAINRATVERFLAGTHSPDLADLKVIDETVAPDIVCHGFPGGMNPRDHESYKEFFQAFRTAFGDMEFRVLALVADEASVSARFRVAVTHVGAFAGIAPTARRVTFEGMVLYRMEGGLIAETWLQLDELSLLGQIGALPALAA